MNHWSVGLVFSLLTFAGIAGVLAGLSGVPAGWVVGLPGVAAGLWYFGTKYEMSSNR